MSSHFSRFYLLLLPDVQVLSTLDLGDNRIGDAGAQQLADALHNNIVSLVAFSSLLFLSYPSQHTGSHCTSHLQKSNWRCRCSTSRSCSSKQHGRSHCLIVSLNSMFSSSTPRLSLRWILIRIKLEM